MIKSAETFSWAYQSFETYIYYRNYEYCVLDTINNLFDKISYIHTFTTAIYFHVNLAWNFKVKVKHQILHTANK